MSSFNCPLTLELLRDPVICSDGHTYERTAIESWLKDNGRSPLTNLSLSTRNLIPNIALRNDILESKQKSIRTIAATATAAAATPTVAPAAAVTAKNMQKWTPEDHRLMIQLRAKGWSNDGKQF